MPNMKDYLKIAKKCLADEASAIMGLIPQLDGSFEGSVRLILECKGKVIVTGVGKSGHIGAKIAATLSSTVVVDSMLRVTPPFLKLSKNPGPT